MLSLTMCYNSDDTVDDNDDVNVTNDDRWVTTHRVNITVQYLVLSTKTSKPTI